MAEIDLESSHNPWVPLPRMVDPAELGDGSVFDGMPEEGEQRDDVWRDADLVKAAYVRSLQYSLDALTSFVEQHAAQDDDRDLVVVMLGDHWPVTTVSGTTAGPRRPDQRDRQRPRRAAADRRLGLGRRPAAAARRAGVADGRVPRPVPGRLHRP